MSHSGLLVILPLTVAFADSCLLICVIYCAKSLVCSVLLPLDRQYVLPRTPRLLSLWDLSLDLFKHKILLSKVFQEKLFLKVLSSIDSLRTSDAGDAAHYKTVHLSLLSMIHTLHFYQPFKEKILEATRAFYETESKKLISSVRIDLYLKKICGSLEQEDSMSWIFWEGDGRKDAEKIVLQELVGKHVEELAKGRSY